MTPALARMRERLDSLIEATAQEIQAQWAREAQEAAEAIEAATSAAAVQAAYQQGRNDREREILALIDGHRQLLARGGVNAISLAALARLIQSE